MSNTKIAKQIVLGSSLITTFIGAASAQVVSQGLTPPANTFRSYQDASIVRDSGLNQPLDLLNDFYPAIEVTATDHENVRRRPDFDEEDLKIVVSPSLAYRTNIGRHQFYAAYNGVFTYHQDLEQEDAESHTVLAKGGLDLSRRWDLDLFAAAGDTFEQRGISGGRAFNGFIGNGLTSGPEEVNFRSYGADLKFGRKIGILAATLGYEHTETSFESDDLIPGSRASDRDRETDTLHFDLNWQFASKTSVFGRVERSDIDYDAQANRLDSEQTNYLVGLRWKPTNALSGVVGVGRTEKDFDEPAFDDYDGNTYYANLAYMISPFTILELGASRNVEEPSDPQATFYESDYFGVGLSHGFTSQLIFDAYAKWVDDDYNTDREDQFFDWGIGLDYAWRSWLTAGIYYGELERESSINAVEYDDAFVGIRIRSDLRSLLDGRSKRGPEPSSFGRPKKTQPVQ